MLEVLLVMLISALLTGCLAYTNNILSGLVPMTLHAEQYMTTMLGTDAFTEVFKVFFGLGISRYGIYRLQNLQRNGDLLAFSLKLIIHIRKEKI